MMNTGLADLRLVAPRTSVGKVGARMAAHAGAVLDARQTHATLAEAVDDCVLVVGTVGRETARREAPLGIEAFVGEVREAAAAGTVALVFGPEDHGLSNEELDLCQRFLTLPTHPSYESLNLAQAVLLCGWELWRDGAIAAPESPARPNAARTNRGRKRSSDSAPATTSDREALFAHLGEALKKIGFLDEQNPEHILRDVRGLFARAEPTRRDIKVWRGIARQINWAGDRARGSG